MARWNQLNGVAEMHIQPILVETYTKHTQTDITLEHEISVSEVRRCVPSIGIALILLIKHCNP